MELSLSLTNFFLQNSLFWTQQHFIARLKNSYIPVMLLFCSFFSRWWWNHTISVIRCLLVCSRYAVYQCVHASFFEFHLHFSDWILLPKQIFPVSTISFSCIRVTSELLLMNYKDLIKHVNLAFWKFHTLLKSCLLRISHVLLIFD